MFSAEAVQRIAGTWPDTPDAEFLRRTNAVSMLSGETLAVLLAFAEHGSGDVLEIGAYIGGATVTMAEGLKRRGTGRLTVIERGGSHQHPQLPSTDILADLRANLSRFQVAHLVDLVIGNSPRPAVQRLVTVNRARNSIGLLCMDSGGRTGGDLWCYEPWLMDGRLVVIDDVVGDNVKVDSTRRFVSQALAAGVLEEFATIPWGTWVGRYHRQPLSTRIACRLRQMQGMQPLIGRYRWPQRPVRRLAEQWFGVPFR